MHEVGVPGLLARVRAHGEAMQAARSLYRDRLAPDFSTFDFIEADEMRLSRILAWLLKPSGSHGQGSRFLEAFMNQMRIAWDSGACANASVRTEVFTDMIPAFNRRVDILIASGDRAIAIENKPWAADQRNQVADYLAQLKQRYGTEHCLIYLSAGGTAPSTESIDEGARNAALSAGRLYEVGYPDLLPWLQACRAVCRADRVSFFLGEFARYIEQHFAGVRDVTERRQLVDQIATSPEMLAPAMQVILAADELKRSLLERLKQQLAAEAATRKWGFFDSLDRDWPGFSIEYDAQAKIRFRFEGSNMRFRSTYFGVTNNAVLGSRIAAILTTKFGKARSNPAWSWHRDLSPSDSLIPAQSDWTISEQPWVLIQNGEMSRMIIGAAEKIRDALHEDGLLP